MRAGGTARQARARLPTNPDAVVLTLITGPAQAGKSRFAESRAARSRGPVTYLATGGPPAEDRRWGARLAKRLERRPDNWRTLETAGMEATAIETLIRSAPADTTLVIDSLGAWLADQAARVPLDAADDATTRLDLLADVFADACVASRARLLVVGDEIGWSGAPLDAAARVHRDVLGRLQQRLARSARYVYLVTAGYAIDIKAHGTPVAPARRRQPR